MRAAEAIAAGKKIIITGRGIYMVKNIMDTDTVSFDESTNEIVIIDQTLLPGEFRLLRLSDQNEIWEAIRVLRVRGAPAIGVTAGFAAYLAALQTEEEDAGAFLAALQKKCDYLDSSRPTAVNLSWALKRMMIAAAQETGGGVAAIKSRLHDECLRIRDEDIDVCRRIGEYGLSLVKPGDGLLTHCNAGKLCAVRWGTATAPMYLGHERGYGFHIYSDETRPLLQGSRLTSFELMQSGLDVTVICDNMSASVMRKGLVNAVFVGVDRMAANGDTANKIGTSMAALAAKRYGVPFYICAPTSSIDMNCPTGDSIVIEQRPAEEVTELWYRRRMAPEGVKVFNPAFDVTDHDLISGVVTEFGIAREPYTDSLREIFAAKRAAAAASDK